MSTLLRSFGLSGLLTIIGVGYAGYAFGLKGVVLSLILVAVEICFSFDNAVINAKTLVKLSPFWQMLFLTVGIFIAIFVIRAFLPIAVVSLTASLPISEVLRLALHEPQKYAHELESIHTTIASFGGAFLLLLGLQFFMASRPVRWFESLEKQLHRYGNWWLPVPVTAAVIAVMALLPFNKHPHDTLVAGGIGIATYVVINGLTALASKAIDSPHNTAVQLTGLAALSSFMYLEVLDASFSFDGVIGAFAITNEIILIIIGLGIGAIWVRSLTVFMVKRRTLDNYLYLEHGAHYAVLALAAAMLIGLVIEVPDVVPGITGIGLIGASIYASRQARHHTKVSHSA